MQAAIYAPEGLELTDDERSFFRDADPAGFILFKRNVESPQQVRALLGRPGAQVGRAALVAPDGRRTQGGVAEAVVEVGVGVDHAVAGQRGQGAQVGQEPGRLGGVAAGVDHQHLVLAQDRPGQELADELEEILATRPKVRVFGPVDEDLILGRAWLR